MTVTSTTRYGLSWTVSFAAAVLLCFYTLPGMVAIAVITALVDVVIVNMLGQQFTGAALFIALFVVTLVARFAAIPLVMKILGR